MQNPPAIVEQSEKPDMLAQIIADAQSNAEQDAKAPKPLVLPPPSKDSKMQNVIRMALMLTGAGMDIDSTNKAMHTPGMEEQNSWIYGKRPSLGRLIATKAVINAPLMWAAHKIAQKSPADGMAFAGLTAAPQALAGILNYSTIKGQKKTNGGGGE